MLVDRPSKDVREKIEMCGVLAVETRRLGAGDPGYLTVVEASGDVPIVFDLLWPETNGVPFGGIMDDLGCCPSKPFRFCPAIFPMSSVFRVAVSAVCVCAASWTSFWSRLVSRVALKISSSSSSLLFCLSCSARIVSAKR